MRVFLSLLVVWSVTGLSLKGASGLSTYANSVAGESQLGAAGPPLSCTTGIATIQVRNAFTTSVPAIGYPIDSGCGVGQNLNENAGTTGPINSSSAMNSTFDIGAQLVTYNGSSQARANYFNIGATAVANYTGASNNMTYIGSEAFAISRETLTIPGATGQPGTFRATITIDGSMSANGNGGAYVVFFYQKDAGPQFATVRLSVDPRIASNQVVINQVPGSPSFSITPTAISGSTQFTFDIPIIFGAPFDVSTGLFVSVQPATTGSWNSTFLTSAKLTGIAILDAGNNPVPNFTVVSGSGTAYGPGGIVPVTPPPSGAFTGVAQTGSAFLSFPNAPAISSGNIAFLGTTISGQPGVYRVKPEPPPIQAAPPTKVADITTAIPGGIGTFTGFSQVATGGTVLRFIGTGSGQAGVYGCETTIPTEPCRRIASLTTAIPGGTGTFTSFSKIAATAGITSFIGSGPGQVGVYRCNAIPTDPCLPLVNLSTLIPNGIGTFTGFSDIALGGTVTRFVATGSGQAGVYRCETAIPGDPCRPIADLNTAIPGGTGRFTGFSQLAANGFATAFVGTGAGQAGVYSCPTFMPGDPCQPVANLSTQIPQGAGLFTGFGAVSVGSGHTAFLGQGSGGQLGIYLASTLTKVIAAGEMVDGRRVTGLRLSPSAIDGETLTFTAAFADGSEGVYITKITVVPPAPASLSFSSFQPGAVIDLRDNAFAAGATFTLAATSNGIAPLTETVRVRVGTFSTVIPAGSFRSNGFGGFLYRGASLVLTLQPLGGKNYLFGALGWNANLAGTTNPVTIELAIGDDAGSKAVTAFFGFVAH